MDDVARELGISKKTLYQFVENKADLINQILAHHFEQEQREISRIQQAAGDAIEELLMITKHVTQMLRQTSPTVTYDLQKYYRKGWERMERFHQKYIYEVIYKNIEDGVRQGIYRDDVNIDIIAKLYVGKTSLIVDEDLFPLQQYNKENLFVEYINYHIHGIASPKGLALLDKHAKNKS